MRVGVGVVAGLTLLAVAGPVVFVQARAADHMYTADDVPATPVALVLGARVYDDGTPSQFLRARLDLAVELYGAGSVEVLLVPGDGRPDHNDEPAAMRRYLVEQGVPAEAIIQDSAGFDTYDSCVRADKVYGVGALTVVTQSFHLARAVTTCRAVGVDAVGVGDTTVKSRRATWAKTTLRDQLAAMKTVVDLVTKREPLLGPPDDAVQTALATAQTH
ncbi:uncharacterized membrane protein [Sanguibacter keddieii DSM 10542]|uniref:Uncharacterized membrane protein n=1 Tax=Sanguibacter keddieii (strain ATCC 51767 / DSM 10542 / NCFB 3025 / ST-74) TaxID=446469 RepID=D1BKD4_SANKS|nr:uncharacterized membrane protein [Sanguibacter keddieii DSM 10542]